MMSRLNSLCLAFLLKFNTSGYITSVQAFSIRSTTAVPFSLQCPTTITPSIAQRYQQQKLSVIVLNAEKEENQEVNDSSDDDTTSDNDNNNEVEIGEDAKEEEKEEDEEEEEEEVVESEADKEVRLLKEEIDDLNMKVGQKNQELNRIGNLAEDFSAEGYSRKVAEMEGFRRTRQIAFKGNKFVSRAVVLQEFLPVLDELQAADQKYAGNNFADNFSKLSSNFKKVLEELEMSDFSPEIGTKIDTLRCNVVDKVYSDEIGKDCVVSARTIGYELQGNVMRMAEVVSSLGSEIAEEEVTEDEIAEGEGEETEANDEDGEKK